MYSRSKVELFVCGAFLCGYMYYATFVHTANENNFAANSSSERFPTHVVGDRQKLPSIPKSSLDTERISRDLWPSDKDCKGLDVKFGKNFNVTFLASYPRSGNTWTRYLIEATTGVFTGSVFAADQPSSIGFYGETEPARSGTTIVLKTHGNAISSDKHYFQNQTEPVIVLVRNLERSITSYWSYSVSKKIDTNPLTYNAPKSKYKDKAFHEFVKKQITIWRKFHEEVLTLCKNLLVIFYEELVLDPIKETKRMVEFLGYEIESQRLFCVKKHPDGLVKKNESLTIDPFNNQERKLAADAMAIVLKLLKARHVEAPKGYIEYVKKYHKAKRKKPSKKKN